MTVAAAFKFPSFFVNSARITLWTCPRASPLLLNRFKPILWGSPLGRGNPAEMPWPHSLPTPLQYHCFFGCESRFTHECILFLSLSVAHFRIYFIANPYILYSVELAHYLSHLQNIIRKKYILSSGSFQRTCLYCVVCPRFLALLFQSRFFYGVQCSVASRWIRDLCGGSDDRGV